MFSGRTTTERWVFFALAVALFGTLLVVGGVLTASFLAVAVFPLAVGFGVAARGTVSRTSRWLAAVLVGLAVLTFLQQVPLPMALLEKISPASADIWSRALLPLGAAPPAWASISLDRGATCVETVKWLLYGATVLLAARTARSHGVESCLTLVLGTAALAALVTLAHGLVGAERVFGLYEPSFRANPWHMGPLLNANNLAGFLNLGLFCGLGLVSGRQQHRLIPRWMIGLVCALVMAVGVTTASRGGLGMMAIGIVLFVVGLASRGGRGQFEWKGIGGLILALVGGALFASLSFTWELQHELFERGTKKLSLALDAIPLVKDFFWTGTGRGAFESVFPAYRQIPDPADAIFSHVENFPMQWVAEWGVPAGGALTLALVWFLRPWRWRVREQPMMLGAWTGSLVLLAQNLVDLALEVPAVCVAFAAVLGAAGEASWSATDGPAKPWTSRLGSAALLGIAAIGIGSVLLHGTDDVVARRRILHKQYQDAVQAGAGFDEVRATTRQSMAAHPADPYFPLVGAAIAWATKEGNPIPWIQRSLERGRINGKAHLLLADILHGRGAFPQAMLELRLAVESDRGLMTLVAEQAVAWSTNPEDLSRVVPEGELGGRVLTAIADTGKLAKSVRQRIDIEAAGRSAHLVGPRHRLARDAISAIADQSWTAFCDSASACAVQARARIEEIRATPTGGPIVALVLEAELLSVQGDPAAADRILREASFPGERDRILAARLTYSGLWLDLAELRSIANTWLIMRCGGTRADCAAAADLIGRTFARRSDWSSASSFFERAMKELPSDERLEQLVQSLERSGDAARAADVRKRYGH